MTSIISPRNTISKMRVNPQGRFNPYRDNNEILAAGDL